MPPHPPRQAPSRRRPLFVLAALVAAGLAATPEARATLIIEQWSGVGGISPTDADTAIASRAPDLTAVSQGVHYSDTGSTWNFAGPSYWPQEGNSVTVGLNDNFAARISGEVFLPTDGTYTFMVRQDDGARLTVGGTELLSSDFWNSGNQYVSIDLLAGWQPVEVIYKEGSGWAALEVAIAQGNTNDIADFTILGSSGSFLTRSATVPDSGGTLPLLSMALGGFVLRQRWAGRKRSRGRD